MTTLPVMIRLDFRYWLNPACCQAVTKFDQCMLVRSIAPVELGLSASSSTHTSGNSTARETIASSV